MYSQTTELTDIDNSSMLIKKLNEKIIDEEFALISLKDLSVHQYSC